MPELIRASTFARLKRLKPRSVRRMLQHRGMPGKKRGATWYVEPAAAAEWLAQHSPRTTAREKGPKVRPKRPPKGPRPERPPADQADAIDRLITAIGERYHLEKLKGRRAEILLEAAIITIVERSAHLRRYAGDLEASRLEQLYRSAMAAKDFRAAMQAHRELDGAVDGKPVIVVIAKRMGETFIGIQALRYASDIWQESDVRSHCKEHRGVLFEPAGGGA